MARLPNPGGDNGNWGNILNDYLSQSHATDGTIKPTAVNSAAIEDSSVTAPKLSASGGSNGQVLTKNAGLSGGLEWTSSAGGGETNTASNIGAGGVGVFKQKAGVNLEFKNINAGSNKVTITNDGPNNEVDIDVVPANFSGIPESAVTNLTTDLASKAATATTISAGAGLTGGGDLSTNRTLAVSYGTTAGTAVEGNDSRLSDTRTPTNGTVTSPKLSKFELSHDFTNDSNGTPLTADSGQAWTLTRNRPGADPVVVSGRYVSNDTAAGASASYLTSQLSGGVVYMEAEWEFGSGGATNGQLAALVAWESALPSGQLAGSNRSPAHVIFTDDYWAYQTFDSGGGNATTIGSFTYAKSMSTQVQRVQIALDKDSGLAVVRAPDGKIATFEAAFISSLVAPHACAEIFYTAADTDNRVKFRKFNAHSIADMDKESVTKYRELLLVAQIARAGIEPTMVYSPVSRTIVATTGVTTIDASLAILAVAPPSGIITIDVEFRLNQTVAGRYAIALRDTTAGVDYDFIIANFSINDTRCRATLRTTTANVAPPLISGKGYALTLRHIILDGGAATFLSGGNDPAVMRVIPTA